MNENDLDLQPLTEEKIREALENLPGWEFQDNKLSKTFEFRSFSDGVGFVYELQDFFNQNDHHPDICINYKKINFMLTRYSIGGKVTQRDIMTARKIESHYKHYEEKGPSLG